jgi:hypothetical protein
MIVTHNVRSFLPLRTAVLGAVFLVVFVMLLPHTASAQWACASGVCSTTGTVGIGTSSPSSTLDLENGNAIINHGGTITASDLSARTLLLGQRPDGYADAALGFQVSASAKGDLDYTSTGFHFWMWNGTWVNSMNISPAGSVGIGTANPQSLLSVKGTITAEGVTVTSTGWSDYVFAPDYRLMPLRDVATFIRENRHLPDIPSEAEVKEKGVSVGDMQSKLLAKVEELTLHMIQADKRNERLEQENRSLQERLGRLEAAGRQEKR